MVSFESIDDVCRLNESYVVGYKLPEKPHEKAVFERASWWYELRVNVTGM